MARESTGILIQRARQRKRMTQAQMARLLGVTRETVSGWERGTAFPARNAGAIEELLGITIPPAPEPASA